MQAPLYLARSGNISGGSYYLANIHGRYWSSTVDGSETAHSLDFKLDVIYPTSYYGRYAGFSLRCVLRESLVMLFSDCHNEVKQLRR